MLKNTRPIPATSRRALLRGVAALALTAAIAEKPAQAVARRPNIIYIIADDIGVYDLGSYGQKKIKTPHMDRMAEQGARFTAAYGGAPICAPSRCALLTGRHMGHASVRGNFAEAGGTVGKKGDEVVRRPNLAPDEKTVASLLRQAGYVTGLVGKWHLDGYSPGAVPTNHGFDEFHGWLTQTETTQGYFPTQWYSGTRLDDLPQNRGGRQGLYETDLCTGQACDFIRRHPDNPFFLLLAYNAPHSPYTSPTFASYAGEDWGDGEKSYAAMIELLDAGIGSVLQTLAETGLDGDTVVFFSSDHGPRSEPTPDQTEVVTFFDSHGPLRGYKRELYEGGIRVPLLARWPGHIAPGATPASPVYHTDLLPTALALAGVAPPSSDGADFSPLLLGTDTLPERFLYWETYEPEFWQAARLGRWKAVRPIRMAPIELYDLAVDPSETTDVAAHHPDLVRKFDVFLRQAHVPSVEYPIRL